MFDNIENLKILSSLHQYNKPRSEVKNRKTHSFFFRIQGCVRSEFADESLVSKPGEVFFVPKGATYNSIVLTDAAVYTAIHFDADFAEQPKPMVFSLEDFPEGEIMANSFSDMWNLGSQADRYICLSLLYRLLSYLSTIEHAQSVEDKQRRLIKPAVDYLNRHIYDGALTVDKLHRLCGISGTYFRKIFYTQFGTTPQSYILSKRLSHAKALLVSGDFNTIAEVALSVGFADPLYFSKAFRKMYGVSPSSFNQN